MFAKNKKRLGFLAVLDFLLSRFVFLLACLSAATVVACAQKSKYTGPYAAQVEDAIPRIEAAVGLKYKHPPKVEIRSRAQVREFVTREFTDPAAQKDFVGQEAAYKRFGLIPDSMNLRKFLIDLLEEQIVGFYDPHTKVLYITQSAPKEAVGITVTHELVHALQDQYIDLDSVQNIHGENDRQSAAQAVFEGQAVYEQIAVGLGGGNVAINLPGGWERVREMIRENQGSMPVFAAAPLLIQETLIFPYLSGAEFVRNFKDRRPTESLYSDMPTSTEQILHPIAYFAHRDEPTTVRLGKTVVGREVYENTLGEFEIRLLLYQYLGDQNESVRGATGWDGDRYVLINTAGGQAMAWLTVWDSGLESGEFFDILDRALEKRFKTASKAGGSKLVRRFSVAGRTVQISATEVAGRPVVLYVDAPAGVSPNLLRLEQVKLTQ